MLLTMTDNDKVVLKEGAVKFKEGKKVTNSPLINLKLRLCNSLIFEFESMRFHFHLFFSIFWLFFENKFFTKVNSEILQIFVHKQET